MKQLNQLKEEVCCANLELVRHGLVVSTWGNVSGVDRERGIMVIKPSGVPYEKLTPRQMAAVRLSDGAIVGGGRLRPSSDTPTHRVLYRAFAGIGGVAHTHSRSAVAFAQARRALPCFGTTHADSFRGPVPVTRMPTRFEVHAEYEENVGKLIAALFGKRKDPLSCPAALVAGHGPFTWGADAAAAAANSIILEEIAAGAILTLALAPRQRALPAFLREKHYCRKHGSGAYYGQQ